VTRQTTRAAFLAGMLGLGVLAIAPPAHAARNAEAETYVQTNATAALRTLGDRSVNATQRRQQFDTLMAQFADMPRIASFVLGRYSAQLRSDAALRTEWNAHVPRIFDRRLRRPPRKLQRRRHPRHRFHRARRRPRCDRHQRKSQPRGGGRPTTVQWRLLRSGEGWKVVDVSLLIEGNQIWLAQQQQRDFLAALDRNNGDIRALMTDSAASRLRCANACSRAANARRRRHFGNCDRQPSAANRPSSSSSDARDQARPRIHHR
jgi:phospholipid transport system substrate-binding protein